MFNFKKGEEVWVYWTVVIPLTFLVMTIWILWMRSESETGKNAGDTHY